MNNNFVSIITPSYKSKKYIGDTIASVKKQTYSNWEMIIVDDCSPDDSVIFIKQLIADDSRIKLISLKYNVGAAMARNKALEVAQGRFIAFLDSDDFWESNKLEYQINFMLEYNCAFSYSAYKVINESGQQSLGQINVPKSINLRQYLGNTIIGCLTVMLDAEKIPQVRMPNLRSSHDMALWADILKRVDFAYGINIPLATYRLVDSSNTANKMKASKDVWQVYRQHLQLNLITSSFYFVQYVFNAVKKRYFM